MAKKKKKGKKTSVRRPTLPLGEKLLLSALLNDRIKLIALRQSPPPPPPPVWRMILVVGRNQAEYRRALKVLSKGGFT